MNLNIATSVRYPDGTDAGTIDKVVFDPQQGQVHEIVMTTPGLLGRALIVPVTLLREDVGDTIVIDADQATVDALPDYVTESYMDPPDGWEMPNNDNANYVPGGELFPATMYYPIVPEVDESNIPEGTIEISQGTEVLCSDGHFGVVDEVLIGDDGVSVTGFVARPDAEFGADIIVPLSMVASADALVLRLNCTLAELTGTGTPYEQEAGEEPESEPLL